MLFNLVLISIEIMIIFMIKQVRNNLTKLHLYSHKAKKYMANFHKIDEDYIKEYNKKYILPMLYIILIVLIIMSISTIIFERDVYHRFIMGGFTVYFIVITVFTGLSMLIMNKRVNE
ncbi:MAG: hypothetical protein ACTHVE_05235 [Senegalia sp. (in: firmicutes)]|uniref:hypothetical protein n=1 Tax=Senegalia sp. (in: firmicutes) TaxID=1924098 RepID=UPI003F9C156F